MFCFDEMSKEQVDKYSSIYIPISDEVDATTSRAIRECVENYAMVMANN